MNPESWKQFRWSYYPAWAREILVYPEPGGKFDKDVDVINAWGKGKEMQKWIFPASQIPDEAIGKEKVGLFVNPGSVEIRRNEVTILADSDSVVVLSPFIQNSWEEGLVDERTRVPLEFDERKREMLPANRKRWLLRVEGQGVTPLIRQALVSSGRRCIYSRADPFEYGVAVVTFEGTIGSSSAPTSIERTEFASNLSAETENLERKLVGEGKLPEINQINQIVREWVEKKKNSLTTRIFGRKDAYDDLVISNVRAGGVFFLSIRLEIEETTLTRWGHAKMGTQISLHDFDQVPPPIPPSNFGWKIDDFPLAGTLKGGSCDRCNGIGEVYVSCPSHNAQTQPAFPSSSGARVCKLCGGSGEVLTTCKDCGGEKVVQKFISVRHSFHDEKAEDFVISMRRLGIESFGAARDAASRGTMEWTFTSRVGREFRLPEKDLSQ